jgi:hypothetical protein
LDFRKSDSYRKYLNLSDKKGNFYSFLRLSSQIFRRSDDYMANFRENSGVVGVHMVLLASIVCCWRTYCAVGVHIVLLAYLLMLVLLLAIASSISGILEIMGLPSAVEGVMFLLSLLLLASLHAVDGFTVLASIPAFGGVHTVLMYLLLLSFLLLLAFLLL